MILLKRTCATGAIPLDEVISTAISEGVEVGEGLHGRTRVAGVGLEGGIDLQESIVSTTEPSKVVAAAQAQRGFSQSPMEG